MNKFIVFILITMVLGACTADLELDLNNQDTEKLVVDALVDNTEIQDYVYLSYTSNYFDNEAVKTEDDAVVELAFDQERIRFQKAIDAPGYYVNPEGFVAEENKLYTLHIALPNGEEYWANSFMYAMPEIDSIHQERVPEDQLFGGGLLQINLSFQDPAGVRNFYLFREAINDTFYFENLAEYGATFSDDFIDGQYAEEVPYDFFELDKGDTLELFGYSLDRDAYNVYNALLSEAEFKGGLFDSPGSNVPSNVEGNNVVGLFMASALQRKAVVVNQ